jgi:DNA polymerase-3 subunit gamma/tau
VRDAQSLLDQAMVQGQAGAWVDAATVRDMLGLADRAQTIELFEKTVRGEAGPAIEAFRTLYAFGVDPGTVMLDLLEHCHGASVAKTLGPDALTLPKDQAANLAAIGAAMSAGSLSRLWQILLKALAEVRAAPDPAAAVEMSLIRLAYASDLPGPEEALRALRSGEPGAPRGPASPAPAGGGGSATARAPAAQTAAAAAPRLASFEDVVRLIDERRDIGLRLDVEKYVRPISFRVGALEFEPVPGAPADLAQRLSGRLKEWSGHPWLVAALGAGGAETLLERQNRALAQAQADALAEPFVQAVMATFPGAEILEVRQMASPEAAPPDDDRPDNEED